MNRRGAKRPSYISVIIILFFFLPACAGAKEIKEEGTQKTEKRLTEKGKYKEGELLVRFKEGVVEDEIRAINREKGTEVAGFIKEIKVYKLKIISSRSVEDMVEAYSKDPRVEYAEPNYIQRTMEKGIK